MKFCVPYAFFLFVTVPNYTQHASKILNLCVHLSSDTPNRSDSNRILPEAHGQFTVIFHFPAERALPHTTHF